MSFTPDSWWRRNGFSEYPGTYVRLSDNDYRLCRPWGGPAGGSRPPHRDAALRISERRGELEGGKEANFAV
ncbi:MAG TPA: hypothetical protein VG501_00940, partial [Rhizomicrobium sp.]|nr:hypothetical protein [Rhizomicrobium sp.]